MAPTVPGDDTLIVSGQCTHRDHIRMVELPALCSRLSDRMGLASVSFAPRIKFFHERSENQTKKWVRPLGTPLIARAVIVENATITPGEVPGCLDGRAVRPC